ncbi:hypothetical protein Ahy_A10g050984 isoform G [Arachis hypogaea]|uniref:non-specific serine/threonine protein kinase n=1 Tax=Arachis hypogaea TaxID=3818 RepID=A0A445BB42_ARAHY|nr:hypothetical protein Ahy_A10g050984 isoform G [Arachis hypogaea]
MPVSLDCSAVLSFVNKLMNKSNSQKHSACSTLPSKLTTTITHYSLLSTNMRIFITHLNYLIIIVTSFFIIPSTSSDTLTGTQNLTTNQTLLSQNQSFVLGFFRGSNTNYYLGIWYNNINPQTIIWVANRDNPIDNSTGYLKIGENGNFVLLNSPGNPAWSSNQTSAKNPVLQLLDTGNLVLKDSSDKTNNNYLWQSFDYPTDTVIPGMKIGWNLDTGTEKHLTSWKIKGEDPSSGDYTLKIDYHGLPEAFLRRNQTIIFRTGPWNGERFSGVPEMKNNTGLDFNFSYDEHGVWYSFSVTNLSLLSRVIVTSDSDGKALQRYMLIQGSWNKFWYEPADECDYYRQCGPYGVCDKNASPICKCMQGFRPKNQEAWNMRDGSNGCVRNTVLNCSTDKFLHLENMKLPETSSVFMNKSMTLDECGSLCKRNCSCTAYANIDIRNGGSGCVMWLDQLIDMSVFATYGQDLFVRLAAADIGDERNMDDLELPMFNFDTLMMATNNFSQDNKLGEGGFGSVYRGRLIEGQEIAVKRLSEDSRQGVTEFENEVKLMVKLQHRNLVRLLGCCIEKNEKILVWRHWHEGTILKLIDPSIGNLYTESEIVRCIHIGLLCVQECAEDRPTMSLVILLLRSEAPSMPNPKIPGFSAKKNYSETDLSSSKQDESWSVNQVTLTLLNAR